MIGKYADTIKLRKELTPFIDKYGHISCSITKFYILLERSTADAEEVKRGHWEYVKENPLVLSYLKCSCCGRASNSYEKYCSNCGARMEADNGLV